MKQFETRYLYCTAFAAFFTSLSQWRAACPIVGMTSNMSQQEYDVILKGVDADVFCPLWASSAMGHGRPLMDETTLAVIRCYRQYGYTPRCLDGNPPDELSEQFRFLAYLYACAQHAPSFAQAAEEFEDRFTVQTVQCYGAALRRYFATGEAVELLSRMEAYFAADAPDTVPCAASEAALAALLSIKPQPPVSAEQPHIIHSAGISNCGGKCKINIKTAEGCALEISTDDSDNAPQIRACVRGRAYRRTFLTPQRLRYPMKRVGERGEGKFRRITWEQAVREIAETAQRLGKAYGPESRYVLHSSGNCGVMRADRIMRRLLNLDGGYLDEYNSYSSACSTFVSPYIYGDAYGGNTERDMLNSKLLILWGHNPTETIFGSCRNYYLAEAKAAGIPILVIDPRMSDTALALADEWIPIRPATDGALADAMAYVIVRRGLHDLAFLHRYCVGFDEQTLPQGAPKGSSYLSYLLGERDGVAKTPAWAQEITGVPAETIERLAVQYATTKPAAILPGFGPQRHGNGEQQTRGIAALACLTGNVGRSGGSAGVPGFCPPRPSISFPQGEKPYSGRIPTFLWSRAVERGCEMTPEEDGLQGVGKLRSNIKMMFCLASNTLINQHSDINRTMQLLKDTSKCELIVAYDLFMTPSARFADILLPATSVLESNNITAPWSNDDYLLSNSRAVQPLFEAKPDYEFVRMVAEQMGLEQEFSCGRKTTEQWLQALYEDHRLREPELPDYAVFRASGGYQFRNAPLRIAYRENIERDVPFRTPSGKIELFSQRLYALGKPAEIPAIPRYVPAPEGPQDSLRMQYPLQLIGYHTKRRCHSLHDRNDWLEELDPPALWLHPADADARGIADGDLVEIYNDRGMVRVPAKVTKRIMQGVSALSQGGWYTPDKQGVDTRGSINVLTSAAQPTPLAKGNPQHTNLVQVRRAAQQ